MSRFDLSRFKTPPDEELICGICRNVLDNPKESPCRHVFCQVCIIRALQEKCRCPICRTPFRERHLKDVLPLVQNMLNKLLMECENCANGCCVPIPMENYPAHLIECEYQMVTCKNSSCGKNLIKRVCAEHETQQCIYRKIVCDKGCQCLVMFAEKEEHSCLDTLLQLKNDLTEKNKELEKRVEELQSIVFSFDSKPENKNEDSRGLLAFLSDSDLGSPINSISSYNSNNYNDMVSLSVSFSNDTGSLGTPSDCSDDYRLDGDDWASDRERHSDEEENNEEVVEEFIPMSENSQGNGPDINVNETRYFPVSEIVSSSNNVSDQPGQRYSQSHSGSAQISGASSSVSYQDIPSSSTEVSGPSGSSRKRPNQSGNDKTYTKRPCRRNDEAETGDVNLRRSARLRQIDPSPVNDIECVPVPPPASYLLDVYSNEINSSSDDSWSPSHDIRY